MIMKRLIYVLCCLLAVFTSCTKDNEDDAPKVGIYSMEDLIAFGDAVNSGQDLSQWKDVNNQSVILYADIDLGDWEWEPINELVGTFDGNNHTICLKKAQTTPYEQWGFVKKNSGIIKNLRVEANFQMETFKADDGIGYTAQSVGGICNVNRGLITESSFKVVGDNKLDNVVFGGIASENTNVGTIELCQVEGILTGANLIVGGICAENNGMIKDCLNKMLIDANQSNGFDCIGGVVAYNDVNGQVLNCKNEADILAQDAFINFYGVGGVAARMFGGTGDGGSPKGNVEGNELGQAFGGIVGNASELHSGGVVISQCHNSGNISGRKDVTGGIVGCIAGEGSSMDGCLNEGIVNGEEGSSDNAIGTDLR